MTDDIHTVDCDADVRCELTVTIAPHCPIEPEFDDYGVTVAWRPAGTTFEKHALRDYLRHYDGAELSQEVIADRIYDDLAGHAVTGLMVRIRDRKHGLEVVGDA